MKDQEAVDRGFMRRCFHLALRGAGRVSPNPLVGALLVRNGTVAAEGWHHGYGRPHAEIDCLRRVGGDGRGMTMYVNLEPCSHYGLTPPCADALVRAGVKRVVVAMRDPNPRVRGRGIRRLRAAGVEVTEGVLEDEARFLNRFFCRHIVARRPYVHLKVAESLDGRISGSRTRWISSLPSRRQAHRWRSTHDAVLVGARTILADRPALTVRLARGRHPHVVVLDGALRLRPGDLDGPMRTPGRRVILCTSTRALRDRAGRARMLAHAGVEVWGFPSGPHGIPLLPLLRELYASGIASLLVEGGADVFARFASTGLVDEISLFLAPRLHGWGLGAFEPLRRAALPPRYGAGGEFAMGTLRVYNSGGDVLVRAFREKYRFTDLAPDA